MNAGRSVQARRYAQAREFGHGRADSAAYAGIPLGEAELIDRDNEKSRPKRAAG